MTGMEIVSGLLFVAFVYGIYYYVNKRNNNYFL